MEFTLVVQVERDSGKFASRDDIGEALAEAINDADLSSLGADGTSEYHVEDVDWS
jgi:hypothetical protein